MADNDVILTIRAEVAELKKGFEESKKAVTDTKKAVEDTDKKIQDTAKNSKQSSDAISGGFKKIGTALLAIGGGLFVFSQLKSRMKDVIASTQTTGDAYAAMMGGMSEANNYFNRSLANMDFSNFFENLGRAYEEGVRYTKMLDQLWDRNNSIKVQQADIDLQISKQMQIAKDRQQDAATRQKAFDEIVKLEKQKVKITEKFATDALENELKNAKSKTTLNEDIIRSYIKNYNTLYKEIDRLNALEAEKREEFTTTQMVRVGSGMNATMVEQRTLNTERFNEWYESLKDTERALLTTDKEMLKIVDGQRQKLTDLSTAQTQAAKSYEDSLVTLTRLRNTIFAEDERIAAETLKLKEEEAKKAAEFSDWFWKYEHEGKQEALDDAKEFNDKLIEEWRRKNAEILELENRFRDDVDKATETNLQESLKSIEKARKINDALVNDRINQQKQIQDSLINAAGEIGSGFGDLLSETVNYNQRLQELNEQRNAALRAGNKELAADLLAQITETQENSRKVYANFAKNIILTGLKVLKLQTQLAVTGLTIETIASSGILAPKTLAQIIAIEAAFGAVEAVIRGVEFRKGGHGIMGGKSHEAGGNYIPGVGFGEREEYFGIISRPMTRKYKQILPDIFDSLNNGTFESLVTNVNNVDLDKSKYLKSIDEKLSKSDQKQVIYGDGYTKIVYKNKTTILRK